MMQQSTQSAIIPYSAVSPAKANRQRVLTTLLMCLGMPAHMKGYRYLAEAVRLALDRPALLDAVTKELYPAVARRFGCQPASVERAIRHSIEQTWQRGLVEKLNELVGSPVVSQQYRPSSSELIALLMELVLLSDIGGLRQL